MCIKAMALENLITKYYMIKKGCDYSYRRRGVTNGIVKFHDKNIISESGKCKNNGAGGI